MKTKRKMLVQNTKIISYYYVNHVFGAPPQYIQTVITTTS